MNIQNVILNNVAQPAKLCMAIGTKGGLCQKGHNLPDQNRLAQWQSLSKPVDVMLFIRRQRDM